MSGVFGDEVRQAVQDGNEGILNKPGIEQTYTGVQVSALQGKGDVGVDQRKELYELGSILSKPFGRVLDDMYDSSEDKRAIEAAGRQGMSTAMNQIDQDKKRYGLAEAWGGQSVEYRTAQMIAVENTYEKMHLDDMDSIEQYAELTPQQFLDHRSKLLEEYTAPWKDDKEALMKITDKFINNTRSLVTMHAKEHKAVIEAGIDKGQLDRFHTGFAIQAKRVEMANGNPEESEKIKGDIIKLMTYNPEVHGAEGMSEERFNSLMMKSTVSELEIGNVGPMTGLLQMVERNPTMIDTKLGKVAWGQVQAAKNAWNTDTAQQLAVRVKDLEEKGKENPIQALRDLENGSLEHFVASRSLMDTDGQTLMEKAKVAKGELRGQDVREHFKNLKLGVKIEGLESRTGRLDTKTVSGLTKSGMDYFVSQKWTKEQAAGIMANLQTESGLNHKIVGDGGKAYGIGQWHPDRQAVFEKAFGHSIKNSTLQEQLQFVQYELEHNEAGAGSKLKQAKTAKEAGEVISKFYERPLRTEKEMSVRGSLAEKLSPAEFSLLTKNEQMQAGAIYAQKELEAAKQKAAIAKEHDSGIIRAMEEVRSAYITLQAANTLTIEDITQFEKEVSELEPWSLEAQHRQTSERGKLLTLKARLQKEAGKQKVNADSMTGAELIRARRANRETAEVSHEENYTDEERKVLDEYTAVMGVHRIEAKTTGKKLESNWLSPGKTADVVGALKKLTADPKLAMRYAQNLDKMGMPIGSKNEVAYKYATGVVGNLRGQIDENGKLSAQAKEQMLVVAEILHEKASALSTFNGKEFAMLSYVTKEILSGGNAETVLRDWGKISTSVQSKTDLEKGTMKEVKGDPSERQKLLDAFHTGLGGDPDTFFGNAEVENPEEFAGFVENYNLNKAAGYDDKTAKEHAKKMLRMNQALVNGHVVYGSSSIRRLPVMDGKDLIAEYDLQDVLNNSKMMEQEWLKAAGTMQDNHGRDLSKMKVKGLGYDVITEQLFVDFAGVPFYINKSDLLAMTKSYHNEVLGSKAIKESERKVDRRGTSFGWN